MKLTSFYALQFHVMIHKSFIAEAQQVNALGRSLFAMALTTVGMELTK